MEDLVIGIDLGTTNSCVSLYRDGKTTVLENSEGGRITPSFVFFTSLEKVVVGEHGKGMVEDKPEHGIYAVKQLIGKKFDQTYIQQHLKHLQYNLEADSSNNPSIVIKQGNKVFKKTPQEICSIILKKLKKDVEAKLGQEVNKVVITVPAYFNVTQREVTLAAARDSGFTVLKLLNEPTAAALFYYFENDSNETNYSIVYDLGGGTFDVAVLKRHANNIEILSVDGDTQLGGQDFDNLLVNYVSENMIERYNFDPRNDKEDLVIIRDKCEEAKKILSCIAETSIIFRGLVKGHPKAKIRLTRTEFENMADKLFQKTIQIVDNCVKASGISKDLISNVILSGGSARIPKIQAMLSNYFDGRRLNKFVNPDECVAEGAAIQAAMLSKHSQQNIRQIQMTDVTALSLGIRDFVNRMDFVIKKNTPIPATGTRRYKTISNNQSNMLIEIFEGERANVMDNRLLGTLTLKNMTTVPPGEGSVKVTMNVDENGILTVDAEEERQHGGNSKELKINYVRGSRSQSEIENTLMDAKENKEEDRRFRRFAALKAYLIKYCECCLYNLDIKNISDKYRDIYEACKKTKSEAKSLTTREENILIRLIKQIRMRCETVAEEYKFQRMPCYKTHLIDFSDNVLINV